MRRFTPLYSCSGSAITFQQNVKKHVSNRSFPDTIILHHPFHLRSKPQPKHNTIMEAVPNTSDVIADINYFPASGIPISKADWKPRYLDHRDEFTRPMLIRDVRTSGKTFELDVHGFQFITLPEKKTKVSRDSDEEIVKRVYYPELEVLAKKLYAYPP
jgi:hypothetical protein